MPSCDCVLAMRKVLPKAAALSLTLISLDSFGLWLLGKWAPGRLSDLLLLEGALLMLLGGIAEVSRSITLETIRRLFSGDALHIPPDRRRPSAAAPLMLATGILLCAAALVALKVPIGW